jgi:hypothetical protein
MLMNIGLTSTNKDSEMLNSHKREFNVAAEVLWNGPFRGYKKTCAPLNLVAFVQGQLIDELLLRELDWDHAERFWSHKQ